jgi:predicted amidohydrolase YtcJ
MTRSAATLLLALGAVTAAPPVEALEKAFADLVVTNGRIYTAAPGRPYAEAFAVQGGRIVFVGSAADATAWIGPSTKTRSLAGRLVLPGIIDSHIHATAIVDLDVCDLKSSPRSLAALTQFVRGCIDRYKSPAGAWVNVRQWNFSDGNQPDPKHATLREALDLAATDRPIQLIGNDGHHGAFNSAALAQAVDETGGHIGLSRATLATSYARYSKLIGVDARGEPNGAVNEEARALMGGPNILFVDLPEVAKVPERITARLNSAGITGILDAAVVPEMLPIYDTLEQRGQLTVRATLAQFYDPDRFKMADGQVDFDKMVAAASAVRTKYAADPLIHSNVVKLFADGVVEGNPYAVPPTLPEVAALHPYLQPIFAKDPHGHLTVTGYVDPASEACRQVAGHPASYQDATAVNAFMKAHGFHPDQCAVSSGQLQHAASVEMEFVRRFHLAGFAVHIHAIGDGGVRTAVDAIEAARAADGVSSQHDALAHVQVVNPEDARRIGRDHLYLACTFSWANFDPEYDMLVVPFFDHIIGNTYAALHPAAGYYESAVYPFKSMKDAGAILLGGSDAPVNTRDPQPFVNIATAVTRQLPGQPPITPQQRISVEEAIDAYTINGAKYLELDHETGSIEVGKSADFVVLDRDIVKLAEAGKGLDIAHTKVLETWFQGRNVFTAPGP